MELPVDDLPLAELAIPVEVTSFGEFEAWFEVWKSGGGYWRPENVARE